MKSFTIHKLDDEASELLEQRARREGTSVNKLAKRLLRKALGLEEQQMVDYRSDFLDLFGTWSKEEAAEFDRAVAEFEVVDEADW